MQLHILTFFLNSLQDFALNSLFIGNAAYMHSTLESPCFVLDILNQSAATADSRVFKYIFFLLSENSFNVVIFFESGPCIIASYHAHHCGFAAVAVSVTQFWHTASCKYFIFTSHCAWKKIRPYFNSSVICKLDPYKCTHDEGVLKQQNSSYHGEVCVSVWLRPSDRVIQMF